jgi:hypothetical protein
VSLIRRLAFSVMNINRQPINNITINMLSSLDERSVVHSNPGITRQMKSNINLDLRKRKHNIYIYIYSNQIKKFHTLN